MDKNLMKPRMEHLPGEEDFLGFSKYSAPTIMLPSKRTESKRFVDSIESQINQEMFKSDEYLRSRNWDPSLMSKMNQNDENHCKCVYDFYNQHSTCS